MNTERHKADLSRPQAAWSWTEGLVVLWLQLALVGIIYRHTLQLAFLSDAWVYLGHLRRGVWTTVTTPIGYHYQPVACAWIALIRALFGERSAMFQAVNVAEVAALGYLTYALGRRLLNDNVAACLASLLLIGNAAFYEIAYWPLAGNMQFLAALLYVLAVIIACDVARGRLGRSGPWLLALTVLAAIFTHPATTTAVPVCGLTLLLLGDRTGDRIGFGDTRAQKLLALGLLAAVAMLFGLTRLSFTSEFSSGPQPGIDSMRAYWLVSRGIVAVVSLRGSHEVVHRMITLGSYAGFDTPAIWWYVGGWLTVTSIALLVVFWRTRTSGVRVLVAFFATHLVVLTLAGGMASRESHIPAVPAALLTAWALRSIAERMAAVAATTAAAAIYRLAPAVVVLLLVASAQADHLTAAAISTTSSSLSRELITQISALAPAGGRAVQLTLVNMPNMIVSRGIGAFLFSNGLADQVRLTSSAVATLEIRQLAVKSAPPDFAAGTVPISPVELRTELEDPSRIVLIFETDPFGLRRLTADGLDSVLAR